MRWKLPSVQKPPGALRIVTVESRGSARMRASIPTPVKLRSTRIPLRSITLLTEKEVTRSWSRLFKNHDYEAAAFDRAEELLDELRPESPLRHRLSLELDELRNRYSERVSVAADEA